MRHGRGCSLEAVTEHDAGVTDYEEPAQMAQQIKEIHQWVQELRAAVDKLTEALGRLNPPN